MVQRNNVIARPDIPLMIAQDSQNLDVFIAPRILPYFLSNVSTATIPKHLRRSRVETLYKPRYGSFPRAQSEVSSETFACLEQGFEEPYDKRDIELYGSEDRAQMFLGTRAAHNTLLAHEKGVADSLFSTSTFGSGYNTAGAAAWDASTGKPLDDIADAKHEVQKRIGQFPDTIVFSAGAYTALQKNSQIQSNVRAIAGQTSLDAGIMLALDPNLLARVFGVRQVLIGAASYDSAAEGQTASMTNVWSDDYCLVCFVGANPDMPMTPSLGRTFVFAQSMDQYAEEEARVMEQINPGMVVETYTETPKDIGVVRAKQDVDAKILNLEAGHLITGLSS